MSDRDLRPHCGYGEGHHLYSCPALARHDVRDNAETIRRWTGPHAFLNNFHRVDVHLDGVVYPTVENASQSAKCADPAAREPFRTMSPAEAKRAVTRVSLRPDRDDARVRVMAALVAEKLSDPELHARLAGTAPRRLVEGNWWHDNFCGACACPRCGGRGENRLGRLLEAIRDAPPRRD